MTIMNQNNWTNLNELVNLNERIWKNEQITWMIESFVNVRINLNEWVIERSWMNGWKNVNIGNNLNRSKKEWMNL